MLTRFDGRGSVVVFVQACCMHALNLYVLYAETSRHVHHAKYDGMRSSTLQRGGDEQGGPMWAPAIHPSKDRGESCFAQHWSAVRLNLLTVSFVH